MQGTSALELKKERLTDLHTPNTAVLSGVVPGPRPRNGAVTRLLALFALGTLAFGAFVACRASYFAWTDAWVAPLQLSPNSREVVAIRMQQAKEEDDRARFESERASAKAAIDAIDLSLEKLRALKGGYSSGIRWSTSDHDGQLIALRQQKAILEEQRAMVADAIGRNEAALQRAERNVAAGVVTDSALEQAKAALAQTRVAFSEKELDLARVSAAIEEASREATALSAAGNNASATGSRSADHASPDVVRFDEVRINVELQIARLEGERREAEARQHAAESSVETLDKLRRELESTPQFQAARRELDLAFVPYPHLKGVHPGDAVYACNWFLFDCHEAGRIKRLFAGEVVADDPWGSLTRGRYVELEMSDRTAVIQRTLRVRGRVQAEATREAAIVLAH
jgi:hypothetical protein